MGASPRPALNARPAAVLLALLAPLLLAAAPATPPIAVYGVEIDAQSAGERVLVFAEAPLEGRLVVRDATTLVVTIPGAVLDPSAPARVAGAPGAAMRLVTISETTDEGVSAVQLVIERAPGLPAQITSRGATLAIELARPARIADPGIEMQFVNTEIAEIVEKVARATGEHFIYDDTLRGTLTVTSPERVSREEALELLNTALLLRGFVALPTPSGARKILPLADGLGGAPWNPAAPGARSEALTATLVHLRVADSLRVTVALQPWLGATALAIAYAPTNALVLAGSEARLRELMTLVAELDHDSDAELVVIRLRHRAAADVAELLLAALGTGTGARLGVEAWPDERTGALVLRAPRAELEDVRALLAEIDVPAQGDGRIRVLPLSYADPEALAGVLASMASGAATSGLPGAAGADAVAAAVAGAESLEGREFSVAVFAPTHALVLSGDPDTLGILEDLVDQLDRPPPSVVVEVLVLQVINDAALDLGFDAFIPITSPKSPDDLIASALLNPSGGGLLQPGAGAGPSYAARFTRSPLVIPFIDAMGNPASLIVPQESAVITATDKRVRSHTLMRPHLRMLAGDEQEIFAGNNIPILVSTSAANPANPANPADAGNTTNAASPVSTANAFQTSQNVERQDIGIRLRLKPTLGEAGGVRLELDVNVSALAPPLAGDVDEVGPTLRNRQLTSTIYLNDDEWAVVGFAREEGTEEVVVGIPWLKDIPILGWAFKTTSDQNITSRLVIAAQARIERSADERIADTIRRRLAFERSEQRLAPLAAGTSNAWALRVATRADEGEAQAIAERLSTSARPAHVTRWEASRGALFDVSVPGFATLADANAAAFALRDAGYDPEVVVLPLEAR